MRQRPRIYYTESQKALMWERWQKGDSLQQIAQLFDRNHSSVQGILVQTGGIRPASRHRSRLALNRTRRNIARGSRRSLDPIDSVPTRASTIHHQPRNPAQRWPAMVSGESSGSGGVGQSAAPQDV